MYRFFSSACFWASDVARYTFSIHGCLVRRAASHTRSIVFQKMLWAISNTRRTVCIFSIRVRFPRVIRRVVFLHLWAFLGTGSFIIKVSTGKTLARQRARASSGAKGIATVTRVRAEAAALVALRATVRFRELLAIVGTFTPAAGFAAGMASRAVPFCRLKVISVNVCGVDAGNDLFPVDGLHMAKVVVVVNADTAS